MKRIAFPGLGLEFNIDPTAFTLFGIEVKWYGLILATGIICAFLLLHYLATKKEGIISDTVYNLTLFVVPISIIGARFVYVVTKWENYAGKGFLNMINIRGGGIAIYGAIIFGLITTLVFCRVTKNNAFSLLDALAPAVMLGQIIGRWGNFVNGEAYGWTENVANSIFRMELDRIYVDGVRVPDTFAHPTFLYESVWNLIGLAIILFVLYRKKKFDGEIFFAYMGWYGLGRAFIESFRADSLYLVGSIKFSVVVGVLCVIASVIGMTVLYRRAKEEALEMAGYTPAYAAARLAAEAEPDALALDTEELPEDEDTDSLEEMTDCDAETLSEQDSLDTDENEVNDNEID